MNEYVKSDEECELTDMQYSFYVSRSNNKEKIKCCHAYFEFEKINIDIEKLKYAYKKVFEENFILRSVIINGKQKILNKSRYDKVNVFDFSKESNENIDNQLDKVRNILKYRLMKVDKGQAIGLTVCILNSGKSRIIYDVDLMILDVQSMLYLLDEISEIYLGMHKSNIDNYYSLNKYIFDKAKDEIVNEKYWNEKIKYMSNGPELPMKEAGEISEYSNLSFNIAKDEFKELEYVSKKKGLTIQVVLLSIYVKVIAKYSINKHFIINIPVTYRIKDIRNKSGVLGNFSDLILLDIDMSKEMEMVELLEYINKEYSECIKMQPYSGINVLRKLNKNDKGNLVKAPVVFSYHVDPPLVNENINRCFGNLKYLINQTPGVLIDFQVYRIDDEYGFYWVFPKDYFANGFIEEAFNIYKGLLFDFMDINKEKR